MPPVLSPLSSSSLVPRHARAKPPFPSPGRHKFWTGGDWQPKPDSTGLEFLAGANASAAVGEPTAISYGPNTLDVFYAHEQNGYHRSWNGNEWAPDSLYGDDLGTPGPGLASTIGAAAKGPGVATVVARASNGSVYQQYLDGDHWSGWEWLGGRHVGSPVVTFKGDQVHLFGVNAGNGQLHHKYWSPDTRKWTPSPRGWETLGGGPFTGGLAALSWGPDRLDVFAIGTDGALYQKYFQTDAYSDWISLGGSGLALQPQVLSPRPGAFEIIAARAGKDGYSYVSKTYTGDQWLPSVDGWYEQTGAFGGGPGIVSWSSTTVAYFGIQSPDEKLVFRYYYGSGWYPEDGSWAQLADLKAAAGGASLKENEDVERLLHIQELK